MIPSQPCVEATDTPSPKCAAWVARLQDDLVAYPYFAFLLGKQPAVRQRVFFEKTLQYAEHACLEHRRADCQSALNVDPGIANLLIWFRFGRPLSHVNNLAIPSAFQHGAGDTDQTAADRA